MSLVELGVSTLMSSGLRDVAVVITGSTCIEIYLRGHVILLRIIVQLVTGDVQHDANERTTITHID